jgi:hypothetical protein
VFAYLSVRAVRLCSSDKTVRFLHGAGHRSAPVFFVSSSLIRHASREVQHGELVQQYRTVRRLRSRLARREGGPPLSGEAAPFRVSIIVVRSRESPWE